MLYLVEEEFMLFLRNGTNELLKVNSHCICKHWVCSHMAKCFTQSWGLGNGFQTFCVHLANAVKPTWGYMFVLFYQMFVIQALLYFWFINIHHTITTDTCWMWWERDCPWSFIIYHNLCSLNGANKVSIHRDTLDIIHIIIFYNKYRLGRIVTIRICYPYVDMYVCVYVCICR